MRWRSRRWKDAGRFGNREVLLHSLDAAAPVRRLPGLSERILSLAYSNDGSYS